MMRIFSREQRVESPPTIVPKLTIAERFRDQIYSHLVGNYIPVPRYPLILAIHGPPGHGKSFQCSSLLDLYGVRTLPVSGSELESAVAGGPAQLIRNRYSEASAIHSKEGRACSILIDDIDAGIGDFGGKTTYTVNRQNVSSLLMNLADNPVQLEGMAVARIPIFVTANNVTSLYEPLRRPGRMTSFYWVMNQDELNGVVINLFSGIMPRKDCAKLASYHHAEPAGFFEQVRAEFISMCLAGTAPPPERASLLRKLIIDPTVGVRLMKSTLMDQDRIAEEVFLIAKRIARK